MRTRLAFSLLCLVACNQTLPPPGASPPSQPQAPAVLLPLEVLGPYGTRADLPLTLARPASTLRLRVHNLQSEDEGHLEVDGGSPIPLDHQHFRIEGPGDPAILARLGADTHPDGTPSRPNGGINGEIGVFDLSLPLSLTAGAHRLSFVLDRAPGISSGYRVVRLDLLDASGRSALAAPLAEVDPASFSPPLSSSQEIAAGQALWNGATLRTSFGDPTPLRAHCGSCHAPDGRDLKYFNYSNRAIEVRAMFHGLSELQGKEIASYIRSLSSYASPYARPWNPPYQPGPGLDSRPVQDWAAGAGIDAVLSSDEETGARLRPEDLRSEAALNVRELPIALQLPDWNHWLPRVAPEDLFGAGYDGIAAIAGEIEAGLERNALGYASCKPQPGSPRGALPSDFDVHLARLLLYYHGDQGPGLKDGVELVRQLLDYARWRVVREWYWMQAYGLEDKGEQMTGCFTGAHPERGVLYTPPSGVAMPSLPPRVEPRSWPGSLVFEVGHAIYGEGQRLAKLKATATASQETDQYIKDAWYWLPLLLTPGNGVGAGNVPIDYGYPPGVFTGTGRSFYRNLVFSVHGAQQRDNGIPPYSPSWGEPCGKPGPDPYLSTNGWQGWRAGDIMMLLSHLWDSQAPGYDPARVTALLEAYVRGWLDTMRRFTPEEWYGANRSWACQWHNASGNPVENFSGTGPTSLPNLGPGTDVESQTYRWLAVSGRMGVLSLGLRQQVADHMKGIYPCVDWDRVVSQPPRDYGQVYALHGGGCP
ncbi:MAG: hypothetical protein ACOYW9_14440 [Deinococcota bacterium]